MENDVGIPTSWRRTPEIGLTGSSGQYVYNTIFLGDFGEHSSLFRSYLPHPDLEWCTVFFVGLLILQGTFYQNS